MKILISIILVLFLFSASAQQLQWSKHIGSTNFDCAVVTNDGSGNTYMGGAFTGYSCFFDSIILPLRGERSIFLAKYDINGNEKWIKQFDNPGSGNDALSDVVVDEHNNIFITGVFYQSATFDTINLNDNNGKGDMYIAKFRPDGTCVWAVKGGGALLDDGTSLAIDELENVYVCGWSTGSVIFGNNLLNPGGFLAKFDSMGNCLWGKNTCSHYVTQFFDGPSLFFEGILVNDSKIYLSGTELSSTFVLDTIPISHSGFDGLIFSCYDTDGNFLWYRELTSSDYGYSGRDISHDNSGNLYFTGGFWSSLTIDSLELEAGSPNGHDVIFLKYTSDGSLIWVKQLNITGNSEGRSLCTDEQGNFYTTGCFSGRAIFGSDTVFSTTSQDSYLARFTSEGQCIGYTIAYGIARGLDVTTGPDQSPIVSGNFKGTVTIGNNTYNNYGFDEDIYLAKYDPITGIETRPAISNRLIIYANPNDGTCDIELPEEFRHEKNLTMKIYNNQGKIIQNTEITNQAGSISVDIQSEAKGIYNVSLSNGKKTFTGKIIFR